ncbi:hypothetical protein [Nocardia acidivorans]|uniref:hypothetical protein n=1 Tax=Nocardia acidivorans TaxID=404580 RepID=UPI0008325AF2|nr:hypothetical protein [Nocardia acidivorans]
MQAPQFQFVRGRIGEGEAAAAVAAQAEVGFRGIGGGLACGNFEAVENLSLRFGGAGHGFLRRVGAVTFADAAAGGYRQVVGETERLIGEGGEPDDIVILRSGR